MGNAGADVSVAHRGLTTKGSIGAESGLTLKDCVKLIQSIVDAAREINQEVIVLSHGGPISGPEDAQYIPDNVRGINGFYRASSMERLA
mmetsp:Transcript_28001/g.33148  ORF Transcript_28001/g.33148 Transcript_28001/m.33148 type:complete len:89 (-) Transcript_28001:331-597(-)